MSTNEVSAKVLVECGYHQNASRSMSNGGRFFYWRGDGEKDTIDPFTDTLEGRRQADAIEDWLWVSATKTWDRSFHHIEKCGDGRKVKLDRIKWCLQQEGLI